MLYFLFFLINQANFDVDFLEKQRLRNAKNFNFMKKNKLSPYDDKLEPEPSSKSYSWAVVQKS
jgi:hypothetical protein